MSHDSTLKTLQAGFTLIELVVSIVVASIVLSFMTMFILGPVNAYSAQERRAELVDATDAVLRTMSRDIRRALPNSIRTRINGNIRVIEMLSTVDALRYRDTDTVAGDIDELDFTTSDTKFAMLGKLDDIPARPTTLLGYYLSIYNVGVTGANAYDLTNVITPAGTKITVADGVADASGVSIEDRITLDFSGTANTNFKFTYGSPARRVYLVSGPVTYLCDLTARTVQRYSGYDIASDQAQRDTDTELMSAHATRSLIANDIGDCNFSYENSVAQRAGLATLDITVARVVSSDSTERVRLLHQVHVENAP